MNISIKDLVFHYESKIVLNKLNLNIKSGETIALLGPSGCGKSTLLKILLGINRASEGEILFNEQSICSYNPKIASHLAELKLFPWMTVLENLLLVGAKEEVMNCLEELDMSQWASYYPSALSVGMTQKIYMARLALIKSDIWLLDEPFNGLDLNSKNITKDFLSRRREGQTAIIVTHNLQEATSFADRVILWDNENHRTGVEWVNDGSSENLLHYMLEKSLGMEGIQC